MIKVLLVDDMALIRKSVRLLIDGIDGIEIIGECNDGQEVVDFVEQTKTDVILMDIGMPKVDGIEATKLISRSFPLIKVIAHSSHNQEDYMQKMYDAGAVDYLPKKQCRTELIKAIRKAFRKN